jgi:hypothetical protein
MTDRQGRKLVAAVGVENGENEAGVNILQTGSFLLG